MKNLFARYSREIALFLIAFLTLLFFRFFVSTGIYQDDEIAHYYNMLEFWHSPVRILNSWAKPGYKILYAPLALVGYDFLTVFNACISALSCVMVFKILREIGHEHPFTYSFLCLFQPFFLHVGSRNYSEVPSAFLIVLAIYFLIKEKYAVFSLITSYLFSLRTELILVCVPAGIFLLIKRKWLPFVLLGTFPLLFALIYYLAYGTPLYLIKESEEWAQAYKEIYPRRGFFHFIEMAPVVWGIIPSFLFAFSLPFLRKNYLIVFLIFFLPYFLFHLLNNAESFEIGYPTGGNLRYMVVLSPVVAILASYAFVIERKFTRDILSGIILIALFIIFTTYQHNNVTYIEEQGRVLYQSMGYLGGFLLILLRKGVKGAPVIILLAISLSLNFVPIKENPEHNAIKRAVEYLRKNDIKLEKFPVVIISHPAFFYYYGKAPLEIPNLINRWGVDTQTVMNCAAGSLIFWENHYFYRPAQFKSSLQLTFFQQNSDKFRMVNQWIGGNFVLCLFQKKI